MKIDNTIEDLINQGDILIGRRYIDILPRFCQCGYPIVISESKRKSKCSNKQCPYRLALRMNALVKELGIKGIGEKTCLDWIIKHKLKYALDLLRVPDLETTRLSLLLETQLNDIVVDYWVLYYYTYILNNDREGWRKLVGLATDVLGIDDSIMSYHLLKQGNIIDNNKHRFKKVNYQKSILTIDLTLTGSIKGFRSRDSFIPYLNNKYGDMYSFRLVGLNKSAHILCTDSDMRGHRKYQNAIACKIPILTSNALLTLLDNNELDDFLYLVFKEKGEFPYDFIRLYKAQGKRIFD